MFVCGGEGGREREREREREHRSLLLFLVFITMYKRLEKKHILPIESNMARKSLSSTRLRFHCILLRFPITFA